MIRLKVTTLVVGIALALSPAVAQAEISPGACCTSGGGCETAVYVGGGVWCCNGICQTIPFFGACKGPVVCYSGGQCTVKDGKCCPGLSINDCNDNDTDDRCEDREACCANDNSCQYKPADCCAAPAGPGTDCDDGDGNGGADDCELQACCGVHHGSEADNCDNHRVYVCIVDEGGTPQGAGTDCGFLPDGDSDNVPDSCDNCEYVFNEVCDDVAGCDCDGDGDIDADDGEQCDRDGDGVGDACDICPDAVDPVCADGNGCDCDGDGSTTGPGDADYGEQCDRDDDGVGDACDNCIDAYNPAQADCNGNGIGDGEDAAGVCEPDCDGDGLVDGCDIDDDGDGANDSCDKCDTTPPLPSGNPPGWPPGLPWFNTDGTLRGDMDGDCDVDQADIDLLNLLVPWINATTCAGEGVNSLVRSNCSSPPPPPGNQ